MHFPFFFILFLFMKYELVAGDLEVQECKKIWCPQYETHVFKRCMLAKTQLFFFLVRLGGFIFIYSFIYFFWMGKSIQVQIWLIQSTDSTYSEITLLECNPTIFNLSLINKIEFKTLLPFTTWVACFENFQNLCTSS